ncbi:MAG: transglycosylase domain-containing protein [Bacteroidia bacterium]|nr:transglycosylase domain-containing protein [Bacteroidia bacterium]
MPIYLFLKHQASTFRDLLQKWPKTSIVISLLLMMILMPVFLYLITLAGAFGPIPDKTTLLEHENLEAARIYSIDMVMLGTYHIEKRTSVPIDSVPPFLIEALIATEDARFYDHDGIDSRSLFRVMFRSLLLGDESGGGGSTISQQLAKAWYPRQSFGLMSTAINKFREMITAQRIEKAFSKQQILELYLNSVSFGEEIFGLEAAAQRYFGKNCPALRPHESALLVGMLKAPSAYHPLRHPVEARQRRNVVLKQMENFADLSPLACDSLQMLDLGLAYKRYSHHDGIAPHFREHLRQELALWCKQYEKNTGKKINLYRSGIRIFTSIHSRLQTYAERALMDQMKVLQTRFDKHWKGYNKRKAAKGLVDELIAKCEKVQRWKAEGLPSDSIEQRLLSWKTSPGFHWSGDEDQQIALLDSLIQDAYILQAGFIALDPTNGHIRAWVGGINHGYSAYDQATAQRQTGSVFKPILYASAIEAGEDPCMYISNEQETFDEYQGWTPRNSDNFYGGQYSMEGALTHSVNVVSAKLIMKIGVEPVLALAKQLGIRADLPPYPSIALGAGDASLLDMVTAYATFANGGKYIMPRYLLRIEDRFGNILADYSAPDPGTRVIKTETAEMITHMLEAVIDQGTGRALRVRHKLRMQLAGKTGTAQNQRDGWFIAMTPSLVAGARVGGIDPRIHWRSISEGQGATTALPMVGYFLQAASDDPEFDYMDRTRFIPMSAEVKEKLDCESFTFPVGMSEFKVWWRARTAADSLRRLGLPVPDSIQILLQSDWLD